MSWKPIKDFECEEVSDDLLVCYLEGGEIQFERKNGRWSVSVLYHGAKRETHFFPFATPSDAAYRITHGTIPMRLKHLLETNGIIEK